MAIGGSGLGPRFGDYGAGVVPKLLQIPRAAVAEWATGRGGAQSR